METCCPSQYYWQQIEALGEGAQPMATDQDVKDWLYRYMRENLAAAKVALFPIECWESLVASGLVETARSAWETPDTKKIRTQLGRRAVVSFIEWIRANGDEPLGYSDLGEERRRSRTERPEPPVTAEDAVILPPIKAHELLTEAERLRCAGLEAEVAEQALNARCDRCGGRGDRPAYCPRCFREAFLQGRALTPAEAESFLLSPAVRFLSPRQVGEWGIDLLGEEAHVVKTWVDPVTGDLVRELAGCLSTTSVSASEPKFRQSYLLSLGKAKVAQPCALVGGVHDLPELRVHLVQAYDDSGEGVDGFPSMFANSVADRWQQLGGWLSRHFPWSGAEGGWLVLTGEVPRLQPVVARSTASRMVPGSATRTLNRRPWENTTAAPYDKSITITYESWLSAQTLQKVHEFFQGGPQGRNKSAAVYEFVNRVRRERPEASFRYLTELWNEEHPEAEYKGREGLFKAYRAASEALAKLTVGDDV